MSFDYAQLHDMTDDEIVVDCTLLKPYDEFKGHSADILRNGMQQFCPPGLKCCFARWSNGMEIFIYFPAQQGVPTREQIVNAFYLELVRTHYVENRDGAWIWG